MKHTPAPWKAERWNDETVYITGTHNGHGITIGHVFETTDDESNTRLIEQSPRLLEVLEIVTIELAHLYHNGKIKANAPEREKIHAMILTAEYVMEQAKGE